MLPRRIEPGFLLAPLTLPEKASQNHSDTGIFLRPSRKSLSTNMLPQCYRHILHISQYPSCTTEGQKAEIVESSHPGGLCLLFFQGSFLNSEKFRSNTNP